MKPRKRTYRLRAVVGVWIASMLVLMVAMLGWAMDMSHVAYVVQQLQVAADAASLAGAGAAKADIPLARSRAQATALSNTAGVAAGVPGDVVMDLNIPNVPGGDIVTGRYYRWDDDTTDPPHLAGDFDPTATGGAINAVKAVAWRGHSWSDGQLPLLFGPIFGVDTTEVSRDAIAMVVGTSGAGLIVLCPDCECALEFAGATTLTLTTAEGYDGDASIVVDSNATGCSPRRAAVCGAGNSLNIDAPEINIVAEGPESSCFNSNADVPPLNPGSPYVPDPLAQLPEPVYTSMPDYGCIGNSGCVKLCDAGANEGNSCVLDADCPEGLCRGALMACEGGSNDGYSCMDDAGCSGGLCERVPQECYEGANAGAVCIDHAGCPGGLCLTTVRAHSGYYPGGFRTNSANSNLILDAGVYSLDNADGGPRAGLVVNGGHFDASAGVMLHIVGDGEVHLAGSGTIIINPIDDETNIYNGISIFQSRTNYNLAVIIGTNDMFLAGTYYFPNNPVEIGGEGIALGNQLIAWTLYLHGNGVYAIAYDGQNPAPGYGVFLVQ